MLAEKHTVHHHRRRRRRRCCCCSQPWSRCCFQTPWHCCHSHCLYLRVPQAPALPGQFTPPPGKRKRIVPGEGRGEPRSSTVVPLRCSASLLPRPEGIDGHPCHSMVSKSPIDPRRSGAATSGRLPAPSCGLLWVKFWSWTPNPNRPSQARCSDLQEVHCARWSCGRAQMFCCSFPETLGIYVVPLGDPRRMSTSTIV